MADAHDDLAGSQPVAVPMSSSPGAHSNRSRSILGSTPRAASTARLASPARSNQSQPLSGSPSVRQIPAYDQTNNASQSSASLAPLAGTTNTPPAIGPGISALAAALSNSYGQDAPRFGTPPLRSVSPHTAGLQVQASAAASASATPSIYGSFEARSRSVQGAPAGWAGPTTFEDPEIVRRHLVQRPEVAQAGDAAQDGMLGDNGQSSSLRASSPANGNGRRHEEDIAPGLDDDEFSSLRLQGGDVTRPIYRWAEEAEARGKGRGRVQRSASFHLSRPEPENDVVDIGSIKVPGGFRRNYIRRAAASPSPQGNDEEGSWGQRRRGTGGPRMLTNNFIEFLTIYGHFAGEDLGEDDEVLEPDEYFSSEATDTFESSEDEREPMEDSALLTPGRRKRKRKAKAVQGTSSPFNAALLLLKSFVGTGVLFLPKAYLNGGMLFSNVVLLVVAVLSYYCFVLLVNTALKVKGSFGDLGGKLYGKWMRTTILFSIVLSQIGFTAAYIVFTAENLRAFILAVSKCNSEWDIKYLILLQMVVFLPLSLVRDISKLGMTALIADAFILVGLIYLYYYDVLTIVTQGGISDIINFNPRDWTLFIGTAIFTFEGIGLIIPIQESMKHPQKFPAVLGGVMIIISIIFISMGALSYAAYGSKTETVVLLNLPQDDKMVNGVQFLYSLAIMLSTPLQIFPAIRITENELFTKSGKYNPYIKWQKNSFRFLVVMLCAAIAWLGANDLDKFVALVGSFACVPLVYIYPPMLHYRGVAKTTFRKAADVVLCIFGLVVMAYTTSLTVAAWASGDVTEPAPTYCDKRGVVLRY